MSEAQNRKVVAVVTDLFFVAKILDSARRAGVDVRFVKSQEEALEAAEELPELIILDLNCAALDPMQVIRSLKARQNLNGIPQVGFVSHVQAERREAALAAGCDRVLPRSALEKLLPEVLRKGL